MHAIDGEYIREWLVLGPFFPNDLDSDFLANAGGEANVEPNEGDTVTTSDGKTLTWKRYESKEDTINLFDAVGNHQHATAYAFCVLQSEAAGDARIFLGSDDGAAVWINGEPVYHNPVDRPFALDEDVFEADLRVGVNRSLVKVFNEIDLWSFAMRILPPDRAVISGIITDEEGEPIAYADVRLQKDGQQIAQVVTNASGEYRLDIYSVRGPYDLSAASGDLGDWRLGIPLEEGERRELDFALNQAVSIDGTLLMLDDATPHVAVPIQILRDGEVIATRLSDERGRYQFINLKPGRYQVRCQVLGGYVYYGEPKRQKTGERGSGDILRVESGRGLEGIDFHFPPLKKGTWRHYTVIDGLATMSVHDIQQDPDGVLWFASCSILNGIGSGVSYYDGKEFANLTTKDGLLSNSVWSIYSAPDGVMWFGMRHGGVSRYDGKEFVDFTTEDGLVHNNVWAILRDPDGVIWFGTGGAGVFRYDDRGMGDSPHFVNFTTEDGLPSDQILSIHRDSDGVMWFGTDGGGVSRYDGKEFVNFTTEDGLVSNAPIAIHRDPDGIMWFGTGYPGGGLSRYDGEKFVNFTAKDGLAHNRIWDIHRDLDDVMWFATDEGVSRYDGRGFVNFTTADGLLYNGVETIHCDPDGGLWFGTGLGGVSRYDEKSFVTFTKEDGLPNNVVQAIYLDPDGMMWLGTSDGLAWYGGDGMGFRIPMELASEDNPISGPINVIHRATDGILWFGTGSIGSARGVLRYDSGDDSSSSLVNFTTADGLPGNDVRAIYSDPDGVMWFGIHGGGVSRYDGKEFVNLTIEDGLVNDEVYDIHRDPDGVMWFGTFPGVLRYDGKEFVNLTTEDGLANNLIFAIYGDPDGVLWFGTFGGVSCYDGKEFVNFTTEDGLSSNLITAICRTPDGVMWFGTLGGGVSGYDGTAWTSLDTRDGLADNRILSIEPDMDGALWVATMDGLTRYRRSKTPPRVRIASIITDQTYRDLSAVPAFATVTRVTIEYNAIDFKTLPEKRQYRCRVYETQDTRHKTQDSPESTEYNPPTKQTSFDWMPEKPGRYIFEVQAIDRDLNYSEPATVKLEVVADPQRQQIAQLESDLEKRNQELERANVELERLNSFKSELLSVVSHELRTPLTSIDGFTRLIHERFLTDDLISKCNDETRPTIQRVKDRVAIVQENTSRLARLINDLLDFSRIERGRELEMHFGRIELSDIIQNVIDTYRAPATEKGLTLEYGGEVGLHTGELEVYGDADRLMQVLSNLVSNAVKFTQEGGAITIGARKERGMIDLWVQDTGVGITKGLLSTIFEPFEQAGGIDAKKSGTGLGLAIVKNIIDRHDGTVRVKSEEGVGSTFIVTLSEYTSPEVSKRGAVQRILIVDDDYDILRLLEEGLSEYSNTRIITATSSKAAFQILEQQQCDVMIVDVRMPGDMNGLDLAAQVREKYPNLKVFVMTNTPEEKERVIRTEANWIDKATPNLIHYIAKKIGREQ